MPVKQSLPRVVKGNQAQNGPEIVMMQRDQDVSQVHWNVQQNNFGGKNNITNMVEHILAQNDLNVGLHRPNYVCHLLEYIWNTELPRG